MSKQTRKISSLRKQIAEKAENWLNKHVFEFLPQQADWSELSPEKFIQVKQYHRWTDKKHIRTSGVIDYYGDIQEKYSRMNIIRVIEKNPKLVILGDPGLGKTTSLNYLTNLYAKDIEKPLPIYLELRYYDESYNDLNDFIHTILDVEPEKLKHLPIIFLLDGFNELEFNNQERVLRNLRKLESFYRKSRWVITSRKVAFPYGMEVENWPTCELLELDKTLIQKYLGRVLGSKYAKDVWYKIKKQQLLDVASVPLLLNLICQLIQIGHFLPNTKGGLLNEIIRYKYLTGDSYKKALTQIDNRLKTITPEECLSLAARLAHRVYEETGSITFDENLIGRILKENGHWKVWNVVKLFEHLRLIERHDIKDKNKTTRTFFSFWHQSFFEYFVGYHLLWIFTEPLSKDKLLPIILPYFEFLKWDEPVKIFLGLCDDEMVERLIFLAMDQDMFLAIDYLSAIEARLSPQIKKIFDNQLFNFLPSCSKLVQKTLIKEVGQRGCSFFMPTLNRLLENEDLHLELGKEIALSIGRIYDHQTAQPLKKFVEDENVNSNSRTTETFTLGDIGDPPPAQPLRKILVDENTNINLRIKAANTLGDIGDSPAAQPLRKILEDENADSELRRAAACALGKIGDPHAARPLRKILEDENADLNLRIAAACALGKIGDPHAARPLRKILEDENADLNLRIAVAYVLGNIDDPHAARPLRKILGDEGADLNLRKASANALGKIGDLQAIQPLRKILEDEDFDLNLHIAAVDALAKIGGSRVVSLFINLLEDENTNFHLRKRLANIFANTLKGLTLNFSKNEWYYQLIELIMSFKKKSYNNDNAFNLFRNFRDVGKRRFIHIDSSELEKQLSKDVTIDEETFKEGKVAYAKMWDNDYLEGKDISNREYKGLLIKKEKYDIFIDNLRVEVYYKNNKINIQPKPRSLLIGLLQNYNRIYTYIKIGEEVWDIPPSSKSIQQAKQLLVNKLKEVSKKAEVSEFIKDRRGEGYIFVGDISYCVITAN